MLFNSLHFLLFFPIVLICFHLIPKQGRMGWLLICSYYFYMSWNAKYALLLLFSTAVTYVCGRMIDSGRRRGTMSASGMRWVMAGAVVLNLAVLFFFKYFDFFSDNVRGLAALAGITLANPGWDILLPVGISFYTFQAVGYAVDVYRGDIPAERNFFRYALFVSFFPQLVAGPIERSGNLLNQLCSMTRPSYEKMRMGFLRMLWGFFMKMVVADRIAVFVNTVYEDPVTYPGFYITLATVLFAFQIYCDFAGYSTIAMGASAMLGIDLMQNFETPYFSTSVKEFWRRWHVSLNTWLRDYLYIPLGGSHGGTFRKYRNLLLVFFASGWWHGAEWSYVVWGLLNGFWQIAEDMLQRLREKISWLPPAEKGEAKTLGQTVGGILITFVLVDFTWLFFRAADMGEVLTLLKSMFTVWNPWILFDGSLYLCGLSAPEFSVMMSSLAVLFMADFLTYRGVQICEIVERQSFLFRWPVYLAGILAVVIFGVWGSGYNAAEFIYFQF